MDKNTRRVLCIRGGGARGSLAHLIILAYVRLSGMTFSAFFAQFDVICGASIGAILAAAYSYGLNPEQITELFRSVGGKIFSTDSNYNTRPSAATKIADIALNIDHYSSPDDYSTLSTNQKYGHELLKETLVSFFGDKTLSSLKNKILIPAFCTSNTQFVNFSNVSFAPYLEATDTIVNVLLATSAAPTYLPSPVFRGKAWWDGGISNNNPVEDGIVLAILLKPYANTTIVTSIGTGRGYLSYINSDNVGLLGASLLKVTDIMNVAMSGAEEAPAWRMSFLNQISRSYYTPNDYFVFREDNPYFASELDDFSMSTLDNMENVVNQYVLENTAAMAAHLERLQA